MKIVVLTHEQLVPPEGTVSKDALEGALWRTEYDVVRAIQMLGHECKVLGVSDDLEPLREAFREARPQIVFNLLEEFAGQSIFDHNVVSYLELMGALYTGSNPRGLMLARDKALCKKVLRYHDVRTPDFHVYPRKRKAKVPAELRFPLLVKTLNEEASLGISQSSIVYDEKSLRERIEFVHDRFNTDAIAEEFIDGREIYVSVLGNDRVEVFPLWELNFDGVPESAPRIATEKVKWDLKYRERYEIDSGLAEDLGPQLIREIHRAAQTTYEALGLSGYARIDLRLKASGEFYVIEANPNPDIGEQEDFALSALESGLSYQKLISRILRLGLNWKSV